MNHRDTKESVLIRNGLYSSTLFEMEIWTLANDQNYTDEDFKEQLDESGCMDCRLRREFVGLFPTKERALEHLNMMYEDPFSEDREIYCTFIRERPMSCMMQPREYIKEWTYIDGLLHDESLVRNYDEDENPFYGRPAEMIRYKRGDIVMIPDMYSGHWGIVWGTPMTTEEVKEFSRLDWSDDQYTILTNVQDGMVSHEHIQAHHVLPAPKGVPEYVLKVLEKGLQSNE